MLTKVDPKMFGGGAVLQVVSATSSAAFTTTANADCLSVAIIPSSASNRILVLVHVSYLVTPSSNAWGYAYLNRNGGNIWSGGGAINSGVMHEQTLPLTYTDSPASTSAVTYTVGIGKGSGGTASLDHERTSITLMEIAG